MAEWIYFIHPPRDDFAATMTDEEQELWGRHFAWVQKLFATGASILVGPTLGPINTGIHVFEADDEDAARRIMESDPAIARDHGVRPGHRQRRGPRRAATVPGVAAAGP